MTKPTRITREDISNLETIYADGRAQGIVINQLKAQLAEALAKNAELKAELRTMHERLKRATALYRQAIEVAPGPRPPLLKTRIKCLRPRLYR